MAFLMETLESLVSQFSVYVDNKIKYFSLSVNPQGCPSISSPFM